MYKLVKGFEGVFRMADEAWIPSVVGNRDWDAYQEWLAEGNEPLPIE
jgi:hypothetical protein